MRTNLQFIFLTLIISYATILNAQNVGIGTSTPAPSAKLDITDAERGVLIPRIDIPNLSAAAPVNTPATSLLVYNTNATTGTGFYYWDGTQWTKVLDNTDTDHDWYEVGTTNAPDAITDAIFTQGRVGIGNANPGVDLDIRRGGFYSQLRLTGGGSGFTNAEIQLVATNSINTRGLGTFLFDINGQTEWFHGRPYAVGGAGTSDAFVISRNAGLTGHSSGTAAITDGSGNPTGSEFFVTVRNNGNVGIGTATPSERLEINNGGLQINQDFGIGFQGEQPFDANVTTDAFKIYRDENLFGVNRDGFIIEKTDVNNVDPDGGIAFIMKGSDNIRETAMSIRGTGNVGIGTITPNSLLHIKGTAPVFNIETNTANQQASGQINFKETPTVNHFQIQYDGLPANEQLNFIGLSTITSTSDTIMSLKRTSNSVGIGTTTPQNKLEVRAEITDATPLRLSRDGSQNVAQVFQNNDDEVFIGLTEDEDFAISAQEDLDNGAYLLVDHAGGTGNVGIGTINPTERLQVNGDARIGLITNTGGTYPSEGNRLYFSGGNAGVINTDNSDPMFLARNNSNSDQSQLRVSVSDNPQPTDALVVGWTSGTTFTERIRLQADGNAQKPGGGAWATLSDRRTKKEIQPFEDGLDILTQINPVTFKYNGQYQTTDDNQTYVGIVAQEVQPIAPYMIGKQTITSENGTQQEILNYDGGTYMIYVLVNAVKQQQQQLQEAHSKNKLLEQTTQLQATELQSLKAEIEAIKALLHTSAKQK